MHSPDATICIVMTEENHQEARARAFDLLRLAHESLSASLRYDYFSNGKGHKQSKAVLAPGAARRPILIQRPIAAAQDDEDVATLDDAQAPAEPEHETAEEAAAPRADAA